MGRDGGILVFALIIVVLLFLGALFVIYDMSGQMDELQQAVEAEKAQVVKFQTQFSDAKKESNVVNKLIDRDATAVQKPLVEENYLKRAWNTSLWFKQHDFWKDEAAAVTEPGPEGATDIPTEATELSTQLDALGDAPDAYRQLDLQKAVNLLSREVVVLLAIYPGLEASYRAEREKVAKFQSQFEDDLAKLKADIDRIQTDKKTVEDNLTQKITDRNDRITKLEQELATARDEYKTLDEQAHDTESDLQAKISNLQSRIEEIAKLRERARAEIEPDGEITVASSRLGLAWINIGGQHGLRKGLIFEVFQYGKGGKEKIKGRVEVRKVEADLAEVVILDSVYLEHPETGEMKAHEGGPLPSDWKAVDLPRKTDPVVKGDLVRNPFFKPNEEQRFVIIGRTTSSPIYDYKDLKLKIQEAGGIVEDQVTTRTHIAVILEDGQQGASAEQFKIADQLGVIIMREVDLLRYLSKR